MWFLQHYLVTMLEKWCGKVKSLKFIYFYLSNRKQRMKVCGAYGSCMARTIVCGSTGINSRSIAIQYFSLQFILLSHRHRYSKLSVNYSKLYSKRMTPNLTIQFNSGITYQWTRKHLLFFSNGLTTTMKINCDKSRQ